MFDLNEFEGIDEMVENGVYLELANETTDYLQNVAEIKDSELVMEISDRILFGDFEPGSELDDAIQTRKQLVLDTMNQGLENALVKCIS
jgi:hypothetical protein